jgi:hypothetical protein
MKYFVEVISDAVTDEQAAAARLAETLKLDLTKALALLRRNPVTKPVSQAEAEKVARLFRKAGIEVFVRSETPESPVSPKSPEIKVSPEPAFSSPSLPEVKVSSPGLPEVPDIQFSSPNLPDVPVDMGLSSPSLPEVQFSSPNLPEVNISGPGWPDPKFSNPNLPDVKVSSSTWPDVKLSGPDLPDVKIPNPGLSSSPQDDALKLPSSFFNGNPDDELSKESVSIPFESKYPTLPPVSEAPVAEERRSGGSVGQFLLASLLPGFLAVAGIAAALYFLGLPFIRSQQNLSLQNAASSIASSISGWVGNTIFSDPNLQQQFQTVINRTQPTLRQNQVDFVLLSDAAGNQLAGWYQDLPTPGVPDNFINPVLPEITRTIAEASTPNVATQQQLIIDGNLTNIASHAVRQQDKAVGVVTVGMREKTLLDQIIQPSMFTLVAGLIPLILSSLLLSLILGRKQS